MLETTEQQNSAEGKYLWTQSFKYRVSFKDKDSPFPCSAGCSKEKARKIFLQVPEEAWPSDTLISDF